MIRDGFWRGLAVAIADVAECISDIAVLADQPGLFGPVASDSTLWRLLERLDVRRLADVAVARAAARETVWAQRAETTGRPYPPARACGRVLPGLVLDLDAPIVISHSEKEFAAPTFKGTYGYHPMLATLDGLLPRRAWSRSVCAIFRLRSACEAIRLSSDECFARALSNAPRSTA